MRKIEAIVHSPERRGRIRTGRGFSLKELKEAELTRHDARMLKIPVDKRRRSVHLENVKTLKTNFPKTKPKPKKLEKKIEKKPKKKRVPKKKKVKKEEKTKQTKKKKASKK